MAGGTARRHPSRDFALRGWHRPAAPSAHLGKLVDLIEETLAGPLEIEKRFVEAQSGIASLVRYDGMRIMAVSKGFRSVWPDFYKMVGHDTLDHLVDEAALVASQAEFRNGISEGTIGLISGVSDRLTSVLVDSRIRHRWTARLRKEGPLMTISMVYDLVDPATPKGIDTIISLDTMTKAAQA